MRRVRLTLPSPPKGKEEFSYALLSRMSPYNDGMRRRIVAGGCALLGAALAVAGACSYLIIPSMTLSCFDRDLFVLHFYDGRVRLFWFHSPVEPIRVEAAEYQAILFVASQSGPSPSPDDGVYGPPAPPAFRVPITIGNRYNVPPLGGGWRLKIGPQPSPPRIFRGQPWRVESSYVRLPVWGIAVLLMIPPIRDSIRERRRAGRKGRNECLECGYNLTGNVSGLCPECGTAL